MNVELPFGYDASDTSKFAPSTKIYKYMEPSIPQLEMDRSEVLHVNNYSWDGLVGIAPLTLFRETLGLTVAANRYTSEFFKKGGRPLGFLTKPSIITLPQRETLQQEWAELHSGIDNAHNVGILSGGLDWKDIGLNNQDAQLLGLRNFQRYLISEIFRVPLALLNDPDQKSTSTSIETLMIQFIIFTMLPLMRKWENEMNMKMFTPKEQFTYFLEHDPTIFLRGDQKTMAEVDEILVRNGIKTIDAVRRSRNMNAYPDGLGKDPLVMSSQMATLKAVKDGTANNKVAGSPSPARPRPKTQAARKPGDSPSAKKSDQPDTPEAQLVNRIAKAYSRLSESNRNKVKGMLAIMNGQGLFEGN